MNKNYYDILQINRNASPEIVEKAYKTLAKKYHPDLQVDDFNKKISEDMLKQINEAYEILSNPEKKALYDESLKAFDFSNDDIEKIYQENIDLKSELNNIKSSDLNSFNSNNNDLSSSYSDNTNEIKQQILYEQDLQRAREKAYHDAYIQDLKNRGYKIRYKKSFKDYFKGFCTLVIIVFVLFLIVQIPFVKNFFVSLYEDNFIIHYLVDIFRRN